MVSVRPGGDSRAYRSSSPSRVYNSSVVRGNPSVAVADSRGKLVTPNRQTCWVGRSLVRFEQVPDKSLLDTTMERLPLSNVLDDIFGQQSRPGFRGLSGRFEQFDDFKETLM